MRWTVLVGATFVACTDGGGTSTTGETGDTLGACELPFGVELGTGQSTFEPLADGDPLELTYGEQGGWHLWTSAKLQGLTGPELAFHAYGTVVSTGEEFAGFAMLDTTVDLSQPGGSYAPGTCSGTFWGKFTFIDPKLSVPGFVCTLDGEALEFRIDVSELEAETGATAPVPTASASVQTIATRDPSTNNPCNSAP
jgi:hypothetical protein